LSSFIEFRINGSSSTFNAVKFIPAVVKSFPPLQGFLLQLGQLGHTGIKDNWIDAHETLQGVQNEKLDISVPMRFGMLGENWKDNFEDSFEILLGRANQRVRNVFNVPKHEGSFGYLKMVAINAKGQLLEQGLANGPKILNWHNIQNFFNFTQEHDLLGRIGLGPNTQQAPNNRNRQTRVLFNELHNTIAQLTEIK
jgi:hypothetical protein